MEQKTELGEKPLKCRERKNPAIQDAKQCLNNVNIPGL